MIKSGITLIIMIGLRILAGWLATQYEFMQEWLIWFTLIVIGVALVFGVSIITSIVKLVRESRGRDEKKKGKEGRRNGKGKENQEEKQGTAEA